MGKSSSQVVGYRYCAKFAMFIGNRIEKLLAINFDNRKWVVHDPLKHPPNLLPVLEGNLFGENEGGVSGNIDIHFGYPDQEPNATYKQYFPLVSGYPYQSYLVFRGYPGAAAFTPESHAKNGFYLGNSGYMKEMLLWVKRIHVKNDGRAQWYDDKSEVPEISFISGGDSWRSLPMVMQMRCRWIGSSTSGVDESGEANFGSAIFPLYESAVSYQVQFLGNGEITNGTHVGANPSLTASAGFIAGNGMIAVGSGTALPPVSWKRDSLPNYENYGDGPIVRQFFGSGFFYWGGGDFNYKIATSSNGAQVSVLKNNTSVLEFGSYDYTKSWLFTEGSKTLEAGLYEVRFEAGDRYYIYGTPRPLIHFTAKVNLSSRVESGDMNVIHKIREILTDDTAMGKPESDVNDVNFMKAADRIYNEGLGISWAIDEKSCIEAIEELCYHIEAGIRVNRQTGLYEVVLFRDDWFTEDEIHDIAENRIKDLSLEVMNSDDIVNQLNVTYYDRERIKNSTFSVYENGSILTMGHTNAESIEFPYFMNMRNAEIVANWKLKQFSTPAWSGSFTTGWREARKWNRYDLIRLPWSRKWNGTILVRIMKINLGNGADNTVTIDFEEVIPYSGEMNTSIVVDAPVELAPQPPQQSMNAVFEAPYYLTVLRAGQTNADLELSYNPDIGYVAAIAAKPQNNSLNALLYTDGGVDEFEQVSRLDYCDILQLDQSIIETTSSFTVTGSLTQAANSNNLILLNGELMGFISLDDVTKVLTVKRGVLDTIPQKHNSGHLFVFDLPDVAFDSTQYAQSEVVEAQVLTTTPSGIQELSGNGQAIEIQARAIRPYPPANVKINGEYWPDVVEGSIVLTWVHRNRVQQTSNEHVGYFDGSITSESGLSYLIDIAGVNGDTSTPLLSQNIGLVNTYTFDVSALNYLKFKVTLKSVRDGHESLEYFEHEVLKPLTAPENFTVTYIA